MSSLDEEFLFEKTVKFEGNYERASIGRLHHSNFRTTNLTESKSNRLWNGRIPEFNEIMILRSLILLLKLTRPK